MRFVIALAIALSTSAASAQTATERAALDLHARLNDMCRGWSGDDPHTAQACDAREVATKMLASMGYCYGRRGQIGADMRWHRCGRDSNR